VDEGWRGINGISEDDSAVRKPGNFVAGVNSTVCGGYSKSASTRVVSTDWSPLANWSVGVSHTISSKLISMMDDDSLGVRRVLSVAVL